MGLSAARNTQAFGDGATKRLSLPQKTNTTIYAGALVVLDGGYAAPGTTATGKIAVGRARTTQTNSGSSGAVSIDVDTDMAFLWENDANDALAQAQAGALCYVKDDHTVSKTSTGKSIAGRFAGFGPDGVQVIVKMGIGIG